MPRSADWVTPLKTLIFTVLVPGTVTVAVPRWLLRANPPPASTPAVWPWFGGVFMLCGVAIYLWCAWDFTFAGRGTPAPIDAPRNLVARGLYRYVRNPMYVGVLSILSGEALWFWSQTLMRYAIVAFSFFYLFVVFYEEPILRAKFGESYRQYCAAVPRWIPRWIPKMSATR